MSADSVHPSTVGTNTEPHPKTTTSNDHVEDPTLPPQRHAGAAGLGPNYPLGPSISDKVEGLAEEIKGKLSRKPELAEHGRDRRTGELMCKEREWDNINNPFRDADGDGK